MVRASFLFIYIHIHAVGVDLHGGHALQRQQRGGDARLNIDNGSKIAVAEQCDADYSGADEHPHVAQLHPQQRAVAYQYNNEQHQRA